MGCPQPSLARSVFCLIVNRFHQGDKSCVVIPGAVYWEYGNILPAFNAYTKVIYAKKYFVLCGTQKRPSCFKNVKQFQ